MERATSPVKHFVSSLLKGMFPLLHFRSLSIFSEHPNAGLLLALLPLHCFGQRHAHGAFVSSQDCMHMLDGNIENNKLIDEPRDVENCVILWHGNDIIFVVVL